MTRSQNSGWYSLRFEILERDEYTCRYCGRSAPSVPLEVDHVTAVVDGGTDDPANLVTCCWSCNRGKEGLRVRRMGRKRKGRGNRRGLGIQANCGECDQNADTIHLLPWVVTGQRWVGAGDPPESKPVTLNEFMSKTPEEFAQEERCWEFDEPKIVAACPGHDPGGYWLKIDDLNRDPAGWINHLREKRGPAHAVLLRWITSNIGHDANLASLYDDKPYAVKWSPR